MPKPSGEESNLLPELEQTAATAPVRLLSVVRNAIVTLENSENPQSKSVGTRARALETRGDHVAAAALVINYLRDGTVGGRRRKTRRGRKVRRTRKSRR